MTACASPSSGPIPRLQTSDQYTTYFQFTDFIIFLYNTLFQYRKPIITLVYERVYLSEHQLTLVLLRRR